MIEVYLGDGLYASHDGYILKLRAPREFGDHVVYLEESVWKALLKFMADRATKENPTTPSDKAEP